MGLQAPAADKGITLRTLFFLGPGQLYPGNPTSQQACHSMTTLQQIYACLPAMQLPFVSAAALTLSMPDGHVCV